jgi:cytochrome b561
MNHQTKSTSFFIRQNIAILVMLIIEFILGVLLTTVVPYHANNVSTAHKILLDVHIGLGVLLLGAAIVRLVLACKQRKLITLSAVGLVALVGAFGSGEASIHGGGNTAVLLMALFFIAALIVYGTSLLRLKSQ